MALEELQKLFANHELLTQALTHKSWVNEHPGVRESNERLEFLGDAVLEFVVSKVIYSKFPDKEEGYLTALRANLVNTVSLSEVASSLGLGEHLLLSRGEEETGGRKNSSMMADTVEAVIGALFMDGGIQASENFIEQNIISKINTILDKPLKDAKSTLQELVQEKGFAAPKYEVVKEEGPDHSKTFTIQVIVNGNVLAEGTGKNKSEGAQDAAKKAIDSFKL